MIDVNTPHNRRHAGVWNHSWYSGCVCRNVSV